MKQTASKSRVPTLSAAEKATVLGDTPSTYMVIINLPPEDDVLSLLKTFLGAAFAGGHYGEYESPGGDWAFISASPYLLYIDQDQIKRTVQRIVCSRIAPEFFPR